MVVEDFVYVPDERGQGIFLQSGSIVGLNGIKLYVTLYFDVPPVTTISAGTVYS